MTRFVRPETRQVLFFLVIGGISAAVDAGVYWILVTIGLAPALSSAISFMSAFVVNYRGNRDLVFRAQKSHGALLRYTILVVVNLGLSAGCVALGVAIGLGPIWAKVVSMILVAVVNFFTMRWWVFPHSHARQPDPSRTGSSD